MVVDERTADEQAAERLWCYLVTLRGGLYAVPDEARAVLLPYITRLGRVTPLPLGLVPPYVLGLTNVGQNGETLVDLGAYLGLASDPAPAEQRRLLVLGEQRAGVGRRAAGADSALRLAFAVDGGHELATLDVAVRTDDAADANGPIRAQVDTPRGPATVLDMAAICRNVAAALGAERPWSAPAREREEG